MAGLLTKTEFLTYALVWLKFGSREFGLSGLKWYYSKPMLKKVVFELVSAGWIKRLGKGRYRCREPNENVKALFGKRVEKALKESGLNYCYTGATAAEIRSNESFIQRSWERSPFYVKVLKKELGQWKKFLAGKEIRFFLGQPENVLGEFVVLIPVERLKIVFYNNKPVEPLKETIAFCEKNADSFEYVLAFIQKKFKRKTTVGKEVMEKVSEAL